MEFFFLTQLYIAWNIFNDGKKVSVQDPPKNTKLIFIKDIFETKFPFSLTGKTRTSRSLTMTQ